MPMYSQALQGHTNTTAAHNSKHVMCSCNQSALCGLCMSHWHPTRHPAALEQGTVCALPHSIAKNSEVHTTITFTRPNSVHDATNNSEALLPTFMVHTLFLQGPVHSLVGLRLAVLSDKSESHACNGMLRCASKSRREPTYEH